MLYDDKVLYEDLGSGNYEIDPPESISEKAREPMEPEFLKEEVKHVIKNLKKRVSPGHDNITNEMVEMGGGG